MLDVYRTLTYCCIEWSHQPSPGKQAISGFVTTTETTGKFPCPTWSSTAFTDTWEEKNKATEVLT